MAPAGGVPPKSGRSRKSVGRAASRHPTSPIPRIGRMSGHSKWAGIKHKKAIVDARRGTAVHEARAGDHGRGARRRRRGRCRTRRSRTPCRRRRTVSMPKDNIERAIAQARAPAADAEGIETVLYEAYGPGGVALLIEAYTDNRNRTGAEAATPALARRPRASASRSVGYLFEKRGVVVVDGARYGEEDLLAAVEAARSIHRGRRGRPRGRGRAGGLECGAGCFGGRRDRDRAGGARAAPDCAHRDRRGGRLQAPVPPDPVARGPDDVGAVHSDFDVSDEVLERVAG